MKTKRFQQYLDTKKGNAMDNKNDVAKHPDNKIDQDFEGYPHGSAKEKVIKPETATEKKTAAVNVKDGEKMENTTGKKKRDEQDSDGSGGAFAGTEDVKD
ncbi:hypothetical protein LZZ85_24950 [Terrimonas sp. NA20]|uniref:Uncharacterized protein n=1 Tax=Terrimonas ginsenosidimutans TaxID=2908004 RepID=A0ABS9KYW4_9BACT|nr:hypothetical protein [Terrimonas ginsenosidimutans]MCG2617572.1 hypothetical protein [Terrimonas ginsenosidimutans]